MSNRNATERANETMRRLQHELRTPIGQIMGYSELIEEELEDRGISDLADDLDKIRTAARRLLDLVDGKLKTTNDPGAPPMSEKPAGASAEGNAATGSDSRPAGWPTAGELRWPWWTSTPPSQKPLPRAWGRGRSGSAPT